MSVVQVTALLHCCCDRVIELLVSLHSDAEVFVLTLLELVGPLDLTLEARVLLPVDLLLVLVGFLIFIQGRVLGLHFLYLWTHFTVVSELPDGGLLLSQREHLSLHATLRSADLRVELGDAPEGLLVAPAADLQRVRACLRPAEPLEDLILLLLLALEHVVRAVHRLVFLLAVVPRTLR